MQRRTWDVVGASLLAAVLVTAGALLPVPLVALGPGPTYNTLDVVNGTPVVQVDGLQTYPTSGHLNMTTIGVTQRLTMFSALASWIAGTRQVVPRTTVYPPDKTDEQVLQDNTAQFSASEADAEVAALAQLQVPTKVVVSAFTEGSPAAAALRVGDEIVAVSGRAVDTPLAVAEALLGTTPGQSVPVTYVRDGQQAVAEVVLGASADRPQGLLGVRPGIAPETGDITISLADVGGPSAGLMFALAVVDKLTPGELTGGAFIAGTGTITPDGRVGPIGGIPFKMAEAAATGATVFLVPADNCAEAAGTAPDGLQLVRVGTLGEAIAGLDALRAGQPVTGC